MPDVVFVYPRTLWDIRNVTTRLPLAALYIGTVLKEHGFSVQVIDQRVDDGWEETLRQSLRERPLWVGISAMTGRQIRWGFAAAQIMRSAVPGIPIVWGGVHPTILPEETLSHALVDIVAVGEGEITALELSRILREKGAGADLGGVAGLFWRRNGRVVKNSPRAWTPMDEWPPLDYGLVRVEDYILSEVPGERSLQITTSRGCPRSCRYCYLDTVPDGRRYRAESPERTVDHIDTLIRLFRTDAVHIIDDEFFTQRRRARRVCELLSERGVGVTLRANCRIDYVERMSQEDLALFHRAGFRHLYLGAESGSDRVLSFIGKDIRTDSIVRANIKLREAGIAPKFSFMGGFPTETISEVDCTLRLMGQLVRDNPSARATPLQLYTPYPGTALYDQCVLEGMPMPQRLEEWAESGWERVANSRRRLSETRFLEKAAHFTFFLDGKTVAESLRSPFMRLAARVYGWIVRLRVRLGVYVCMPEVALIRWALAHRKSP